MLAIACGRGCRRPRSPAHRSRLQAGLRTPPGQRDRHLCSRSEPCLEVGKRAQPARGRAYDLRDDRTPTAPATNGRRARSPWISMTHSDVAHGRISSSRCPTLITHERCFLPIHGLRDWHIAPGGGAAAHRHDTVRPAWPRSAAICGGRRAGSAAIGRVRGLTIRGDGHYGRPEGDGVVRGEWPSTASPGSGGQRGRGSSAR